MTVKPRYEKKQAPIPASKAPWCQTPELYYAGRAAMDGADKLAVDMEAKWGIGRLRLLVSNEWREKFDRQRNLYNEAIADGALEDVRREAARMEAAWRKLDREAAAAGHQQAGLRRQRGPRRRARPRPRRSAWLAAPRQTRRGRTRARREGQRRPSQQRHRKTTALRARSRAHPW